MQETNILQHKETKPSNPDKVKQEELKKAHSFYKIKHTKGNYQGLIIKKAKIVDKLKEFNFFRFDVDYETCRFVYIEDNKVREVSKEYITDKFEQYVEQLEPFTHKVIFEDKDLGQVETEIEITSKRIRETLLEKLSEYFSKVLLYRLVPPKPIVIKRDNQFEKFFYYQNGFVVVSKEGYKFLDYKHLDKNIWENQRLNRDFKENKERGDYECFFERICGHTTNDIITKDVKERILALKTIVGYNLHGFFDCERYAHIITDSTISDGGEDNGRSGKTLWAKSLGQVLNYYDDDPRTNSQVFCEIPGKNFNVNDKHRYSDAGMETQLTAINDLNKNTDFSAFLNDVTEGITVDKKNEKPFRINSKMLILTNKTLNIEGDSARGRVKQFEFSNYFNADYTPTMELKGRWMFSKTWPVEEWNKFDTFMIDCVYQYFKHGLIEASSINLHRRTLIDHTCQEFVDFMDDFLKTEIIYLKNQSAELFGGDTEIKLIYGEKMDKKKLFTAFTEQYPNDHKHLKQSKFTKFLRSYTKHTETLEAIKKPNTEGRSNGVDWIIFNKIDDEA